MKGVLRVSSKDSGNVHRRRLSRPSRWQMRSLWEDEVLIIPLTPIFEGRGRIANVNGWWKCSYLAKKLLGKSVKGFKDYDSKKTYFFFEVTGRLQEKPLTDNYILTYANDTVDRDWIFQVRSEQNSGEGLGIDLTVNSKRVCLLLWVNSRRAAEIGWLRLFINT